MKLHLSTVINNISTFENSRTINGQNFLSRDCTGIYLYWKVCEYFKPKSVLEIGFLQGLSFGLFFESTDDDTLYVSVEYNYRAKHTFDQLFKNHPKLTNIKFIEINSMDLDLTEKFDFMHVDGNHTYEYALNDIQKCLQMAHNNSIICVDDIGIPDVEKAIQEQLLGQNGFVPFLMGDREIFFHHESHNAEDFLDNWIHNDESINIITYFNYNYHGITLLRAHTPRFFDNHKDVFLQQLQLYNL